MRRRTGVILALVLILVIVSTGCSKAKKKEAELQGEIAQLQSQLRLLESRNRELAQQNENEALAQAAETRQLEEALKALEIRVTHDSLKAFKVEPYASLENGWLLVDGEHTFTLLAHDGASKVSFYWADKNSDLQPRLLGEDANGADGWSWTGVLPYGNNKAFWAEIHYPGGLKTLSPVLPVRNGGK